MSEVQGSGYYPSPEGVRRARDHKLVQADVVRRWEELLRGIVKDLEYWSETQSAASVLQALARAQLALTMR